MVQKTSSRVTSLLLAVVMFLSLGAFFGFDRAYADSDGEWQFETVAGGIDITGYIGTDTAVTVPAKIGGKSVYSVSGLSGNNFKSKITSITLSSGIKVIGNNAFSDYSGLTRVSLPDTLTTIGANAFYNCLSLTAVTLPTSVSSIGSGAFSNCTSLLSANLTCQATEIPDKLFEGCSKLSTLTLPPYATSIGNDAFRDCSILKSVNIPNSVKTIGDTAFSGCTALSDINMPTELKSIGEFAFRDCKSITSVFFSNKIKTIGDEAFKGCTALQSVYISPSVSIINKGAFNECSSLEKIVFGGDYINSNNIFDLMYTPMVYYPSKYSDGWASYSGSKTSYNASTSVSVSGTTKLTTGKKSTLKITVNPSTAGFSDIYTIVSSNTSVATVSSTGTVTAKNPGAATITVTTISGATGTAEIKVMPAAPTSLKAVAKSTTSVDLTWSGNDATGYYIYRSTSKNGTYKKIDTVLKTSYTDKGLTKGKTYYYKVAAYVNSNGATVTSEDSSIVSVKVTSPAPSSVSATKTKSGVATIKWSKSTGASGYEVYMATSSSGKYSKVTTIKSASTLFYKKTGLTSGKTYYFKVRSYVTVSGSKVYSDYTKVVKVKV